MVQGELAIGLFTLRKIKAGAQQAPLLQTQSNSVKHAAVLPVRVIVSCSMHLLSYQQLTRWQ
jgi:hypothetical protein